MRGKTAFQGQPYGFLFLCFQQLVEIGLGHTTHIFPILKDICSFGPGLSASFLASFVVRILSCHLLSYIWWLRSSKKNNLLRDHFGECPLHPALGGAISSNAARARVSRETGLQLPPGNLVKATTRAGRGFPPRQPQPGSRCQTGTTVPAPASVITTSRPTGPRRRRKPCLEFPGPVQRSNEPE